MKPTQVSMCVAGAIVLIFGLGFAFHLPFATSLWPWPDGPLSYLFIGSILAAVSAAMLWIGVTGEWGALPAGALNIFVIAATTTCYLFYLTANGRPGLALYAVLGLISAMAGAAAFLQSRAVPLNDDRPTPGLVRASFAVFVVALFLAGGALILRLPIFPWALNPDSSVIFGCIFLGDAFYFIYALLKLRWYNALGQLLSFLAYDLVLIGPFINLQASIKPERELNLIVYIAVLLYSGVIAIYFLFIDRRTRLWVASTGVKKPHS